MLKALKEYGILLKGIIHIGAHEGQEYEEYRDAGIVNMIFFEPVQDNFKKLVQKLPVDGNIRAINIALGNYEGEAEMFIEKENRSMSCSILEPGKHLELYPWITFNSKETVQIDKLDNIQFDRRVYNILNIDVQGYELEVLKGASKTLKRIDAIFTEVNKVEVYKNCALIYDIDIFLADFGFVRMTANLIDSWGDALYIKNKFLNVK